MGLRRCSDAAELFLKDGQSLADLNIVAAEFPSLRSLMYHIGIFTSLHI